MYKGTIVNPEAIPIACEKFTEAVIKLYKEGKLTMPNKTKKE